MRWDSWLWISVALLVGSIACSPAAPTPLDLTGTWVMENPIGVTDQTTRWELSQSGSKVTGTSSRTAPFLVSDTGTIAGGVSGASFTLQWDTTTDFGGSGACRVVTTSTTGLLTIADNSMTGVLTSTPQPPCASRSSATEYSFRKR